MVVEMKWNESAIKLNIKSNSISHRANSIRLRPRVWCVLKYRSDLTWNWSYKLRRLHGKYLIPSLIKMQIFPIRQSSSIIGTLYALYSYQFWYGFPRNLHILQYCLFAAIGMRCFLIISYRTPFIQRPNNPHLAQETTYRRRFSLAILRRLLRADGRFFATPIDSYTDEYPARGISDQRHGSPAFISSKQHPSYCRCYSERFFAIFRAERPLHIEFFEKTKRNLSGFIQILRIW